MGDTFAEEVPAPVEPEPAPVEPEPAPVEPEPTPVVPEPAPVQPSVIAQVLLSPEELRQLELSRDMIQDPTLFDLPTYRPPVVDTTVDPEDTYIDVPRDGVFTQVYEGDVPFFEPRTDIEPEFPEQVIDFETDPLPPVPPVTFEDPAEEAGGGGAPASPQGGQTQTQQPVQQPVQQPTYPQYPTGYPQYPTGYPQYPTGYPQYPDYEQQRRQEQLRIEEQREQRFILQHPWIYRGEGVFENTLTGQETIDPNYRDIEYQEGARYSRGDLPATDVAPTEIEEPAVPAEEPPPAEEEEVDILDVLTGLPIDTAQEIPTEPVVTPTEPVVTPTEPVTQVPIETATETVTEIPSETDTGVAVSETDVIEGVGEEGTGETGTEGEGIGDEGTGEGTGGDGIGDGGVPLSTGGGMLSPRAFQGFTSGLSYVPPQFVEVAYQPKDYTTELNRIIKESLFQGIV